MSVAVISPPGEFIYNNTALISSFWIASLSWERIVFIFTVLPHEESLSRITPSMEITAILFGDSFLPDMCVALEAHWIQWCLIIKGQGEK